jgi:hypothetical protein
VKQHSLAVLGGPESGKSTYLGALIDLLDQGLLPRLELDGSPEDLGALDRLADPLRHGGYPKRTPIDLRVDLQLPLLARDDPHPPYPFVLSTGDLAGESVDRVFKDRLWSEEWDRWAACEALLLFIRPEAAIPLPDWTRPDDPHAEWLTLRGEPVPVRGAPAEPGPDDVFGPGFVEEAPPVPPARLHDPQQVPTALAIVELLQLLRSRRGLQPGVRRSGALRIALVVSAWDTLPDWQRRGPGAWLASAVPLVEDFLWSNFAPQDVRRFGLSSTGGDLKTQQGRERYQLEGGHVVWLNVQGQVQEERDISLPLRWALLGDAAFPAE